MHTITFITKEMIDGFLFHGEEGKWLVESENGNNWIRPDEQSARELATILDRHEKEQEEFNIKYPLSTP